MVLLLEEDAECLLMGDVYEYTFVNICIVASLLVVRRAGAREGRGEV